jgi:hexosaminidase
LQSYFIGRIEKYINSRGKQIIGWDEILEGGLTPNATVMSWRGEEGGIEAAKQNHDVIMTPTTYVYFDYTQTKNEDSVVIGGFLPLEKVYSYEPIPPVLTEAEAKHVLGGQANLWTEYITNPAKVGYMIFPRLAALSEVLWSPKSKKNYSDFEKRLQVQFKRYDLWKSNYSKAYFDIQASVLPAPGNNAVVWKLESKLSGRNIKIEYNYPEQHKELIEYREPLTINKSIEIAAILVEDGRTSGNFIRQKFFFNKATGKKIMLTEKPAEKWPGNGGVFGLVNGALSNKGINSAEWLGWQGKDMEAIIDLGTAQSISSINCHLLEQKGSWIYLPAYIEAFTSADGSNFTSVGKTSQYISKTMGMYDATISTAPVTARYAKIIAKNYGKIPDGQAGEGNNAWLFVDEIQAD